METDANYEFAVGLDDVVFYSHGSKMLGGFYRGAGQGPRPTAILLHGVPGVEKNLDIAYALRDKGWNCLYFHYRGSWGSEGDYSFAGALEDVYAAVDWVLQQPSVDPERLAVIGNSFGGYVALAITAAESRIQATVSISPLVDPGTIALPEELFEEFALMLNGVTAAELKVQWDGLPAVQTMRPALDGRPILLITADRDEIFPAAHYESLAADLEALVWSRIAEADHVFSTSRAQLVQATITWLVGNLGA